MRAWKARAVAGVVATAPMTVTMLALYRRLPHEQRYHLPPREIVHSIIGRCAALDAHVGERGERRVTVLAHFAYGGLAGALYPPLTTPRRHPLLHGALYGVGVWSASYLGWIPALGILKIATEHPSRRNRLMLASHLVWGACTALAARRLVGVRPAARAGAAGEPERRSTRRTERLLALSVGGTSTLWALRRRDLNGLLVAAGGALLWLGRDAHQHSRP